MSVLYFKLLGIQSPIRPENVAIGDGGDIVVMASARDGEVTQPVTGATRSKSTSLFLAVLSYNINNID